MNKFKHINTWIFDLDHCLYPQDNELSEIYNDKFTEYVSESCKIPYDEVDGILIKMREKYGKARIGLTKEYGFTLEGWENKIFGVAVRKIKPCKQTVDLIDKLSGKKIVCTNSMHSTAIQILEHIGLKNSFSYIDTFSAKRDFSSKPSEDVYTNLIDKLELNPKTCAFFEDSHANLKVPHELGMTTVLVHGEVDGRDYIHHAYPSLLNFLKEQN